MKRKPLILFLCLTVVLMTMSYLLLTVIDRHAGILLALALSIAVVCDLVLLTRLFQKFMRP